MVDPMSEMYSSYSPYAYVGNDPILFHDPNGMYRVDANGNITIDDPDEISSFFNYLNNSSGASINDMSNQIISAGKGFSWELDAVTVTGKRSFESGGWLSDAQGRVSDAVGLMGNINSISAGQLNFEQPSGNMGGLLNSGAGAVLSVGSHMMYNKESWYSLRQMKSYSHRFHGNQYTGGRLAHGKAWGTGFRMAGYGLGAFNAVGVTDQYLSGEINTGQFMLEQGSNTFSTFGGVPGAAWGVGWEIGRAITNIPGYHENVRLPARRFLGIKR